MSFDFQVLYGWYLRCCFFGAVPHLPLLCPFHPKERGPTQAYPSNILQCLGPSMLPTFNRVGDTLILDRTAPRWGRPISRGDIVVARTPQNANQTVCKRVIATSGQTVRVKSREWYVPDIKRKVPIGHVWLEGDNSSNSTDSRHYGPVPLAMVHGRVMLKVGARSADSMCMRGEEGERDACDTEYVPSEVQES
ncbi:unnamed protein product [Discosporangium mesarthrocarpum]